MHCLLIFVHFHLQKSWLGNFKLIFCLTSDQIGRDLDQSSLDVQVKKESNDQKVTGTIRTKLLFLETEKGNN